jgi:hypothetical protein
MTENDKSLIRQMMKAGRYNAIFDLMPAFNLQKSKDIIQDMGSKWCCHSDNQIRRLDVPLEILKQNQSKILKRK